MSEKIVCLLLNESNIPFEEININRPKTYNDLILILRKNCKNLPKYYYIFYQSDNNKEIIINNNEEYKQSKDILFIRKKEVKNLSESIFSLNYNILSEAKQDILDNKYACNICNLIIKDENPLFCYRCQKIFHQKCLEQWDKKKKLLKQNLACPNCNNELPLEQWKKKLDFEEMRKNEGEMINKIKENEMNQKLNININKIKDKKIHELHFNHENFVKKVLNMIKDILNEINSINILFDFKNYNNNLINILTNDNSKIEEVSNIIIMQLNMIKNKIKQIQGNSKFGEANSINENKTSFYDMNENNINNNIINNKISFSNLNENSIININIIDNKMSNFDLGEKNINNNIINVNEIINYDEYEDIFPYINSPKKAIIFINSLNDKIKVKIPNLVKKNDLYSIAQRFINNKYSDILLYYKNNLLDNDDTALESLSDGDSIGIKEEINIDHSYENNILAKYQNSTKINVMFKNTKEGYYNITLPLILTCEELMNIYFIHFEIPPKYRNDFYFLFNKINIKNIPNEELYTLFKNTSNPMILVDKIRNFEYYIPKGFGKIVKVLIEDNKKRKIVLLRMGIFEQIKVLFLQDRFELSNFDFQNVFENPKKYLFFIGEDRIEINDERALVSLGIRNDFELTFIELNFD